MLCIGAYSYPCILCIVVLELRLYNLIFNALIISSTQRFKILVFFFQDSLQRNRMTRFYLKQREDPHGPSISLFVGNLPTGLAQRQYEKLLLDFITPGMQLLCFKYYM